MEKAIIIILGLAIVLFISFKIVRSAKSVDPYDDVAKRND